MSLVFHIFVRFEFFKQFCVQGKVIKFRILDCFDVSAVKRFQKCSVFTKVLSFISGQVCFLFNFVRFSPCKLT